MHFELKYLPKHQLQSIYLVYCLFLLEFPWIFILIHVDDVDTGSHFQCQSSVADTLPKVLVQRMQPIKDSNSFLCPTRGSEPGKPQVLE